MRKIYQLLALTVLMGCNKDHVDPQSSSVGTIQGFLNDNPKMTIVKTTESDVIYTGGVATHRGYIFKPVKDIEITALGGRIAQKGIFRVEIFEISDNAYWTFGGTLVYTDSLRINGTDKFEFKPIGNVPLVANQRYILRYFNLNHESVYDAGLGLQSDANNFIDFPLILKDVEIEVPYFSYARKYGETYAIYEEGAFREGMLRGLIDFKYELAD